MIEKVRCRECRKTFTPKPPDPAVARSLTPPRPVCKHCRRAKRDN